MTHDVIGRSALLRLAVVALLAVGLVGMHHLVVTACHQAGAAASAHAGHGEATPMQSAPMQSAPAAPAEEAPGGLVGAAAMCLAILLLVAAAIPAMRGWVRRLAAAGVLPRGRPLISRVLAPPDLTLLSISRT